MVDNIGKAVDKAYKEVENAGIDLDPSVELVLEFMNGDHEEWGYYFADHDRRIIFWFEAHKSSDLIGGVRGVKCADHISEFFMGSIPSSSFFHCTTPRICIRITVLVRTASGVYLFLTLTEVDALKLV